MLNNLTGRSCLGSLVGLCVFGMLPGLNATASAQGAGTAVSAKPHQPVRSAAATPTATTQGIATLPASASASGHKYAKRYFIEFRARTAQSYGHAYSVYGRLDAQGKIVEGHVAGLHPATESVVPWMVGHLVPVPSETGASDGDREDEYISARYRIELSEPEYRKVVASIKELQASSPLWHAVFYNCNAFIADIARSMGLKTPPHVLYPELFVNNLRAMNTGADVAIVPSVQWGLSAAPPPPPKAKGAVVQ